MELTTLGHLVKGRLIKRTVAALPLLGLFSQQWPRSRVFDPILGSGVFHEDLGLFLGFFKVLGSFWGFSTILGKTMFFLCFLPKSIDLVENCCEI